MPKCFKCGADGEILINRRCVRCNPFCACPVKLCPGTLVSKPTPNWMNRWVCDKCGKKVSR